MEDNNLILTMPVLPLRGLTAFPGTNLNFDVERPLSIAALNAALAADQQVFLVSQKDISTEVPSEADLYTMGTVCPIRQILRIPGGGMVKVPRPDSIRKALHHFPAYSPSPHGEGGLKWHPAGRHHFRRTSLPARGGWIEI